jgi:hypothetical protein
MLFSWGFGYWVLLVHQESDQPLVTTTGNISQKAENLKLKILKMK